MSAKKTALTAGGAAVIAATVAFLPGWEGMDRVAKRDAIGTGHPVTYCYGQTSEFGDVKVGTRFTKTDCDEKLAQSLPRYLAQIEPCVKVPVPPKTMAALLDAAYNAGSAAVCRSPMVAKINAGNIRAGCEAFAGWYVRSDGQVRRGLVARRGGDGRKGEKQLCLEGLSEPKSEWRTAWTASEATPADPYECFGAARYQAMREGRTCDSETPAKPVARKAAAVKKTKEPCAWWRRCT